MGRGSCSWASALGRQEVHAVRRSQALDAGEWSTQGSRCCSCKARGRGFRELPRAAASEVVQFFILVETLLRPGAGGRKPECQGSAGPYAESSRGRAPGLPAEGVAGSPWFGATSLHSAGPHRVWSGVCSSTFPPLSFLLFLRDTQLHTFMRCSVLMYGYAVQ